MNDSLVKSFLQEVKSFLIQKQQIFHSSITQFQKHVDIFLVSHLFSLNQKNISSSNQNQIQILKIKENFQTVQLKSLVNEIIKLENNLKYLIAFLVVFICSKNKQKQLSLYSSFYYEILNSLIKQLKKDDENIKKTQNNPNNIKKNQRKHQINKYCTQQAVFFLQLLISSSQSIKINNQFPQIKTIITFLLTNSNKVIKQAALIKSNKLIKIITSILCLPEAYFQLQKLIKTILTMNINCSNSVEILQKIEYKFVMKLKKYQYNDFNQINIVDLLKLIFPSIRSELNELIQNKDLKLKIKQEKKLFIENKKNNQSDIQMQEQKIKYVIEKLLQKIKPIYSSQKKQNLNIYTYGYHIMCFIIEVLSNNQNLFQTDTISRKNFILKQLIFVLSIHYFYPLQNTFVQKQTIRFYNTIVFQLINENDIFILKICLNFLHNQSISQFSVHKLKSLFKLLTQIAKKLQKMENINNKSTKSITSVTQNSEKQSSKQSIQSTQSKKKQNNNYQLLINQEVQLAKFKISRIIRIFEQLTQLYRDKNTEIIFNQNKSSKLNIDKIKNSNSLTLNLKLYDSSHFIFHRQSMLRNQKYKSLKLNQKSNNTFMRLFKFIVGKSETYQVLFRITSGTNNEQNFVNRSRQGKSQIKSSQNFWNLEKNLYSVELIIYKDKDIVVQDQIKCIQKIASSYFQFNIVLTCNKSKQSKGSEIFLKINEKLIIITSKQKRNQITSLQFSSQQKSQSKNQKNQMLSQKNQMLSQKNQMLSQKNQMLSYTIIKNLYLFNCQIPENILAKLQSFNSFQLYTSLIQILGSTSINYRINEISEEIIQNLKKQQNVFFKKQLKIVNQNISKRRSILFIDVFKQIGGLNSVFYILQKINKSYSTHFGQKTQHFFVQIFKILKNIAAYDKQKFLFYEVKKSYSYVCHFLFLIFKRNEHLASQRSSYFIDSIFKFLMFFSNYFTKDQSIKQYPTQEVFQLELTFIKQVLCNFEIWSECSLQIQSFIFLTLESFLKNQKFTFSLFSIDIHSKILSSVTFFYSEQLNPLKNKFQQKILMICQQLYDKMLSLLLMKNENDFFRVLDFNQATFSSVKNNINSPIKDKSQSKQKQQNKQIVKKQIISFFNKYIHRDVNQTLSFVYSLILYHDKKCMKQTTEQKEDTSKFSLERSNVKSSIASLSNNNLISIPLVYLPSELKTCFNILNYFQKNFIQKEHIFHIIEDDWSYVLSILIIIQENLLLTRAKCQRKNIKYRVYSCQTTLLLKIQEVILKIVSKKPQFFNYMIQSLQKILTFKHSSLHDIFYTATQIIHLNKKVNMDIIDTVFFLVEKKINSQNDIQDFFNYQELEKHLYKMADPSLTYSREFQSFLETIFKNIQDLGEKVSNYITLQSQQKDQKDQKIGIEVNQNEKKIINKEKINEQSQKIQQGSYKIKQKQVLQLNSLKRSKLQIKKIFSQLQNLLFQICYQTGSISAGNSNWISSYLSKKYLLENGQQSNYSDGIDNSQINLNSQIDKINILKNKRMNMESNLKIGYYCSEPQITYFMQNVLQRLCQDQQTVLGHKIINQTPNKNQQNKPKNLTKNHQIQTEQQINQYISSVLNTDEPLTFWISNPKLSMDTIYQMYKILKQLFNPKQMNQNLCFMNNNISLLSFNNAFMASKALQYIFQKYSFNQENSSEKPIQASKRKKLTLNSLEILSDFLKRKQIDSESLYYSLLTDNQVNQMTTKKNSFISKIITTEQRQIKKNKQIQQNLQKFIQMWYLNNNPHCKINPHDQQKVKSPKKLNFQQKKMFQLVYEKLIYICLEETNEQTKIKELFSFMTEKTKGSESKIICNLFKKIIYTLKYVIQTKHTLTVLSNPQLFQNQQIFINCPKLISAVLGVKQVQQYRQTLTQKFNKILQSEHKKSEKSENKFKIIQKENQFWLEIDQKDHQRKDQIYELDEKQIGSFGFYKLNIKPSIDRVEQIHYPRRKMFSSIKSSQNSLENQIQENGEDSILLTKNKIFNLALSEENGMKDRRNTLLEMNATKNAISRIQIFNGADRDFYLCEYVTKRGVYAGKLIIKNEYVQFKYISHLRLPEQAVYRLSTGKFHQINSLTEDQQNKLNSMKIPFKKCKLFTRRFILRHTAIQLFQKIDHQSYFFNLFLRPQRQKFLNLIRYKLEECIENPKEQFRRKQYTEQWQTGALSNFQYISLINRYSGRSTNDLAQYYVFPWVVTNYNGKGGFNQLDSDFLKQQNNLRNLACPPGKLSQEKFMKLKMRLMELDFCQPEDRFLYGTMFSNPTVLYNFFIRLQPYIHLHWQHQGKRIDHADRLFSGIQEQFSSVLTASSDMKELTPQFYYWPQFLKNRSYIDLGQKQNKQEVDDVILPIWAHSPEQFIFKMRYALQSYEVSEHLHEWIDLTFGYKVKYQNAQQSDNLYHFNSYQRQMDYFQQFAEDQKQIRSLQVSISEFGQVPQALFDEAHPTKNLRHQFLIIDKFLDVKYNKRGSFKQINQAFKVGFQICKEGIFIWTSNSVQFKKSFISQNYTFDQQSKVFDSLGSSARLLSFEDQSWMTLNQGMLRIFLKKMLKFQKNIEAECLDIIGNYYVYSKKSSIYMDQYDGFKNELTNKRILYGHKDQIIEIICSKPLDLILSIDLEGFVMLHQLSNLSFLRNFQLPLQKQWSKRTLMSPQNKKDLLKVQIHEMGYFIFLINQKKIVVITFLGEIFLEHDIEIVSDSKSKRQEQKITDMVIFRHDQSILLLSTDKGNIYEIDFIQMKRYNQIYPYKTYTRVQINVLDYLYSQLPEQSGRLNGQSDRSQIASSLQKSISKQSITSLFKYPTSQIYNLKKPIHSLRIEKIVGDKISLYQIIVQYQTGQIMCFYQQKYLGKQLKKNQKLKQLGLFF